MWWWWWWGEEVATSDAAAGMFDWVVRMVFLSGGWSKYGLGGISDLASFDMLLLLRAGSASAFRLSLFAGFASVG